MHYTPLVLALLATAHCLDLRAHRAATPPAPPPEPATNAAWLSLFRRYTDPLPASTNLLPLCGNGVVNTAADYNAHYQAGGAPIDISARYGPGMEATVDVTEVCDDGNRLDGDGCSADCMTLDAIVSVCSVRSLDMPANMEKIVIDSVTGKAYAVTATEIYGIRVNLTVGAIVFDSLAQKPFPADAVSDMANGVMHLYEKRAAAVHRFHIDPAGALMEGNISTVMLGTIDPTTETGYFFTYNSEPYLMTKNHVDICIAQIYNPATRQCFNFGVALTPVTRTMGVRLFQNFLIVFMETVTATIGLDTFTSSIAPVSRFLSGNIWGDMFTNSFQASMLATFTNNDISIGLSSDLTLKAQLMAAMGVEIHSYSPTFVQRTTSGIRNILLPTDTYAGDMMGMGNPDVMRALVSGPNNLACDSMSHCVLDIPLGYDIFDSNGIIPLAPSYFDICADLASSANISLNQSASDLVNDPAYKDLMANIQDEIIRHMQPIYPKSLAMHPHTGGWWILRNDQIVYVSQRGSSVMVVPPGSRPTQATQSQCLPVDVGVCGTCAWAEPGQPCQQCSAKDDSSTAWQIQCGAGSRCSMGARRRLLTALDTVDVQCIIANCSLAEAASALPQATIPQTDIRQLIITISTNAPDTALRQMRDAISSHSLTWIVVTQPAALYATAMPDTDESSGSGNSMAMIAGVIGGVVGATIVGVIAYSTIKYMQAKKPTQPAATPSMFNNVPVDPSGYTPLKQTDSTTHPRDE